MKIPSEAFPIGTVQLGGREGEEIGSYCLMRCDCWRWPGPCWEVTVIMVRSARGNGGQTPWGWGGEGGVSVLRSEPAPLQAVGRLWPHI